MSRGPYKSNPRKFKSKQSSPSARGPRSSYQRQEGPKTFKVGEIEYPYLIPGQIIKWLSDTEHINNINDLKRWTDSNLPPTPKVVQTPLVGTSEQKKLKLATDAVQNATASIEMYCLLTKCLYTLCELVLYDIYSYLYINYTSI